MTFKIEKNIPAPTRKCGGPYPDKNSFSGVLRRMEVGDSVFAEKMLNTASGTWNVMKKRDPEAHGHKEFTARTVTENGVKGVRVWRVK